LRIDGSSQARMPDGTGGEVFVRMTPLRGQRGIITLGDARRAAAESDIGPRLRDGM
jgi:hypothetical protein